MHHLWTFIFMCIHIYTDRRQLSCFPFRGQCTDDKGGYANDISIHSWDKNDLEQKNNISNKCSKK